MNELSIDLMISIINVVNYFIFTNLCSHLFHERKYKRPVRMLLYLVFLSVLVLVNLYFDQLLILMVVVSILNIAIGLIFYDAKVHVVSIFALFFIAFSFLCELIAALLLSVVFANVVTQARENAMYMLLGGITSKILLITLAGVFIRIKSRKTDKISINYWFMILTIPIVSIVLSIFCVYEPIKESEFHLSAGVSCIIILYINSIVFYLFTKIVVQIDDIHQYQKREMLMKLQEEQFNTVIEGYDQVKKVRHDMVAHLIAIEAFIENGEVTSASEYIRGLSEELDIAKRGIISGNIAVDAMINNRCIQTEKNKIDFQYDIAIPSKMKIEDLDLSIILGNLLNNSIEACKRVKEGEEKEILLKMRYMNECVLIETRNSFDITTIRKIEGRFISSKEGRGEKATGIGLGNINEIVVKYNGAFQTEMEKNKFIVKIMIPDRTILW